MDRLVSRTRLRPMARGAISSVNASIFVVAQCLVWLTILSRISMKCVLWAIPLVVLVGFYPYSKRVTNYPQTVLGVTLSWGTLIGSVALGIDPLDLAQGQWPEILSPMACIFGSYVIWTMMIDMIYAHQDLQDDMKAGILSMAVCYRDYPKFVLSILGVIQVALLAAFGAQMQSGSLCLVTMCVSSASLMMWMISCVDLRESAQCWWWFQNGSMMMGAVICGGLSAEYFTRLLE